MPGSQYLSQTNHHHLASATEVDLVDPHGVPAADPSGFLPSGPARQTPDLSESLWNPEGLFLLRICHTIPPGPVESGAMLEELLCNAEGQSVFALA